MIFSRTSGKSSFSNDKNSGRSFSIVTSFPKIGASDKITEAVALRTFWYVSTASSETTGSRLAEQGAAPTKPTTCQGCGKTYGHTLFIRGKKFENSPTLAIWATDATRTSASVSESNLVSAGTISTFEHSVPRASHN